MTNLELVNGDSWVASAYDTIKQLKEAVKGTNVKLVKVGEVKLYEYWVCNKLLYRAKKLPILSKKEAEKRYNIIIEE